MNEGSQRESRHPPGDTAGGRSTTHQRGTAKPFSTFWGIDMKNAFILATVIASAALVACGKKEEAPVVPAAPAVEAPAPAAEAPAVEAPVVVETPAAVTEAVNTAEQAVDAAKAEADKAVDAAKVEADKAVEAAKSAIEAAK